RANAHAQQRPHAGWTLQAGEPEFAWAVCCSRLILIMASEGRVGACPKRREIKVLPLSQRGIFRKDVPSNHDAGSGPHHLRSNAMRFYNQQHRFYCGVDLHARTMYLCILDDAGRVVYDKNLAAEPEAFLNAVAPFRDGLVVAVECLFCWYWLADLCAREHIAFVLGHALYRKAIHGGKSKNDHISAANISPLLRRGTP